MDDNHDGAESVVSLAFKGHDVRTADDGSLALALAETWRRHLVVLDIGLPGMNGYEVARHFGQHPWRHNMRLVVLSGWGQGENPRLTAEAGFDAHLVKPADIDALPKLVAASPKAPE